VVKFFLGPFYILKEVRLRLVGPFEKSLVQFGLGFCVFELVTHLLDLLQKRLIVLLFLLKSVCKEQTLLDSALGSGWRLSDSLDECVAHFEAFTLPLVASHMHDRLVQLLLDHLVVG
jgi:hypothetical protein